MSHDPLCPVVATDCAQCPQCALIARVRADERERVWSGVRWRNAVGDQTWSIECVTDSHDDCTGCLCIHHAEQVAAALQARIDGLRAKVEALFVRCTDDPTRGEELADFVRRDAVFALIDGADQ